MTCINQPFAGINENCEKFISAGLGVVITDIDVSFTPAEWDDLTVWQNKIKQDESIWAADLTNWENTTDDPNIVTTALGWKDKTNNPPPSGVFYLSANPCDYSVLHGLEGAVRRIIFITSEGKPLGHMKEDGSIVGFKAKLATRKNAVLSDAVENSYPLYTFFRDVSEFENWYIGTPDWNALSELIEAVPVGLTLRATSNYNVPGAGQIQIVSNIRCTATGKDGLLVADFEVTEANVADAGVTAVTDNGNGLYDITVQKDVGGTPTDLADSTEYVKVRVKVVSGSDITFVSLPLKVKGA